MVLKPVQPKDPGTPPAKGTPHPTEVKKSLHILAKKQFEHECQTVGIVYALVALEVRDTSALEVPPPVSQVISEYGDIAPDDLPDELPGARH